jgi:GPI-anchor transamidase subunit GAA1
MKPISVLCNIIRVLEIVIPFTLRQTQISRMSKLPSPSSLDISGETRLIKSFSLLALGIFLSTLSTLNFSLGFFLGVLCSPLAFLRPVGVSRHSVVVTILAIVVMQLISPLNWFYFVSKLEYRQDVLKVAQMYRFAWKVWGTWTPLVWWCIWWPAWLVGLVVLAAPA